MNFEDRKLSRQEDEENLSSQISKSRSSIYPPMTPLETPRSSESVSTTTTTKTNEPSVESESEIISSLESK